MIEGVEQDIMIVNNIKDRKEKTMSYSSYIKLIGYLSENCTDKDYHKAMIKLDKFNIKIKD